MFIVHGRSHDERDTLATIVRDLGCVPKILSKEPKSGKSIIEEFEDLARTCVFALILLTPDDPQADKLLGSPVSRARQNVIFEMGWFFSQLGKQRTRLVHKGPVELPSDVTGIMYIEYPESELKLKEKIEQALREGGLLE